MGESVVNPGPRCAICTHPRRGEIDSTRGPVLRVAKRFDVSKSALDRHRKHAEVAPPPSLPPPPPLTPDGALAALEAGMARIAHEMAKAASEELPKLTKAWEALEKARDRAIVAREVTEEQVLASAWWSGFKARIVEALRPYPDAARAVVKAMAEGA